MQTIYNIFDLIDGLVFRKKIISVVKLIYVHIIEKECIAFPEVCFSFTCYV